MLSDDQVRQFHQDGFLDGGPCLSGDEVDELRDELQRVIADRDSSHVPQPALLRNLAAPSPEDQVKLQRILADQQVPDTSGIADLRKALGGGQEADDEAIFAYARKRLAAAHDGKEIWQIVNIWMASKPFRRLIEHPKITEEVAQLAEARELRIWHDQIQYKPAVQGGVNMWHQDAPLWPVLTPMTEVSAWVALDDVDEGNGCMSMVPGSHRWGDQIRFLGGLPNYDAVPSSFEGHEVRVVRRPVRKGEVHYHHALTWHGSHANTSDRPRRAVALHYLHEGTRYVASGQHPIKHLIDVPEGAKVEGPNFPLCWSGAPGRAA